jgi:hypothetical protein
MNAMSEPSGQPVELTADPLPMARRKPRRPQVGLSTLVLLIAVCGVGMTVVVNRRQIRALESSLPAIQQLARALKIDDPGQIAVVKLDPLWMNDDRWDVYLPAGEYRICMATQGIDVKGLGVLKKSAPIKAGRHRLELEFHRDGDLWKFQVISAELELLSLEETKEWGASGQSSGGGDVYSTSTQLPTDEPLVLYRRRNGVRVSPMQVMTPRGPSEGILLWIERVAPSDSIP